MTDTDKELHTAGNVLKGALMGLDEDTLIKLVKALPDESFTVLLDLMEDDALRRDLGDSGTIEKYYYCGDCNTIDDQNGECIHCGKALGLRTRIVPGIPQADPDDDPVLLETGLPDGSQDALAIEQGPDLSEGD